MSSSQPVDRRAGCLLPPPSSAARGRLQAALRIATLVLLTASVAGCLRYAEPGQKYEYPGKPFQYAQLGDVRVHYRETRPEQGSERGTVLFIHGYAGALVSWWYAQRELGTTYRTVALDLKGFGLSDKVPGDYSIPAQADLVIKLMDQLGVARTHLVAHSWGCSVALDLARRYPERVQRLVLLSAYVYDDQLNSFMRWSRLPGVGELLFGLFYDEQLEVRYTWSFAEPDRHVTAEMLDYLLRFQAAPGVTAAALAVLRGMDLKALQPEYAKVDKPALLVWGALDRVSPPTMGARLSAELPGAELVVLPRSGHSVMVERRHAFHRLLQEFLTREVTPEVRTVAEVAP